ncbi:hypothetical protein ACFL5Q_05080 [Planctomycetota bacterium]
MRRAWKDAWLVSVAGTLGLGLTLLSSSVLTAAEDPAELKLIPVDPKVIEAREKSLAKAKAAPEGAELVAYLDCGTQRQSVTTDRVKIALTQGKPYLFRSEAKDVGPTEPTIFFHESQVVFKITGLDRTGRYLAEVSWWDYDDGSRTQSVVVGSADSRLVRLAVPAIRLPNYETDAQMPARRRFSLPATFARGGEMQLTVGCVTGANAVISELWIWQMK